MYFFRDDHDCLHFKNADWCYTGMMGQNNFVDFEHEEEGRGDQEEKEGGRGRK